MDAAIAAYGKETYPVIKHPTDFSVAEKDKLIALLKERVPCLPGDRLYLDAYRIDSEGDALDEPYIAVHVLPRTGLSKHPEEFTEYYLPLIEQFMRYTASEGWVVLRVPNRAE